ncbi:Alpha/Beta hydrolase protein [Leptodontidium sp. 2 PMI_412]|nr:Alpha/Beta hydrolase protein [Leptodontidium sp. 2 PMI_412]
MVDLDLIEKLAAEGHDVYAWDMPGFGNSYDIDIDFKPDGIIYYVEKAMIGVKDWGLPKFHVLGHHSGASIATELAALHGDQVLSLTIVGPALLTSEEQVTHLKEANLTESSVPFNKPVADVSHLLKTWDQLHTNGEWDPGVLHGQTLDALRAWKGRLQIYTNLFAQPALKVLSQVKCPVLGMCAPDDSLFPKF